jgi:hypothetical protein
MKEPFFETLQKLRQLAQLPDERTLLRMDSLDIESKNAEIAEAISQYKEGSYKA